MTQRYRDPSVTARKGFRPDIEGLRAIAVLAVVVYHAWPGLLPGGFVGVDVFFVLSGFLITRLLVDELERSNRISFMSFYARRAKRLLPAASFVIVLTLIAMWFIESPMDTCETALEAVWVSLFSMNIYLGISGIQYGEAESSSIFQHFWSLAVEEQFYIVWPLVILLTSGVLFRRSLSRKKMNLIAGSLFIASFAYGIYQTSTAQSLAYFGTPTRAWELLAGAILAINTGLIATMFTTVYRNIAAWGGVIIVLLSALLIKDTMPFPGYIAAAPVVGTLLAVAAGSSRPTSLETWWALKNPIMQGFGKISYSLYLWHWPFLVLAPTLFDTPRLNKPQLILVVTAAIVMSIVTFWLLENPVRHAANFRQKPVLAAVMGMALILFTSSTGALAHAFIPEPKPTGPYQEPPASGNVAQLHAAIAASTNQNEVPSNLVPALVDIREDQPRLTNEDGVSCMVDVLDTAVAKKPHGSCIFGDPHGTKTIALVGDSHSYQWAGAIDKIARDAGWRMVNFTKGACPAYDVQVNSYALHRDYTECYEWRANMLKRLEQEKPDIIVTSAFVGPNTASDSYTQQWANGVKTAVSKFGDIADKVFVIEDTPRLWRDMASCIAIHLDDYTKCSIPSRDTYTALERRELTKEAARSVGAQVISTRDWFCDDMCPGVISNMAVYSDSSHITDTYAQFLSPLLGAQLRLTT